MKKMKWILPVAAFAVAATGLAGATGLARAEESENTVIPSKVYIGDIAVGGMSAEEAKEAVWDAVDEQLDAQITLRAGENEMTVTAEELGVQWANTHVADEAAMIGKVGNLIQRYKDVKDLEHENKVYDIEYSVSEQMVSAWLDSYASTLNQEPVDNGLKRENGEFIFIEGQEGIEVNIENSIACITSYFAQEWEGTDGTISLAADVIEPEGSKEELEAIQDVLGYYSTDFSDSTAGRITNVKNATAKIDGTVLYPGEEFSVHDAISPLNAENGYELAGSYENGTTVESYGGGVCQVSTTLYNALIRAELEITERFAHSMLVSYVQPSMDAAIAGDYKDLCFKNSLDTPIYIEGYTSGGILYFNVFGKETRPENRTISFVSETVSQEDPITKFVATGDPVGTITRTQSSHTGKTAQLWKIVTVDGVEESREVFNKSKYNSSPTVYSVGTGSANAEAVAEMNNAIATQDEATIRAAAGFWNDTAIAERTEQEAQQVMQQQQEQQEQEAEDDNKKNNNKKNNNKKNDSEKNNDSESEGSEGENTGDDSGSEDAGTQEEASVTGTGEEVE